MASDPDVGGATVRVSWRVRAIVMPAGLLTACFLVPSSEPAAGTLTLNADGSVEWVGVAVDADNIQFLRLGDGVYCLTNAAPTGAISVIDNSLGRLQYFANANQAVIFAGTADVTQVSFDDQGGGNAYFIQSLSPLVPMPPTTIRNTSVQGVSPDQIVVSASEFSVPLVISLASSGVIIGTDVTSALVNVNIDYSSTKRASLQVVGGQAPSTATVNYSGAAGGVTNVTLKPQTDAPGFPLADVVAVRGTAAGVPVTVNGISGADAVVVGNAGSLAGISGPVNIQNDNGTVNLTLDGSAGATPSAVAVSASEVTGLAPATIGYVSDDLTALAIRAGVPRTRLTCYRRPQTARLWCRSL